MVNVFLDRIAPARDDFKMPRVCEGHGKAVSFMIQRYNSISFVFGIPGILLQIIGNVLGRTNPDKEILGIFVSLAGTGLLLVGLAYYAMAKGRSPAWCLMAFLSLIGLIVLACLQDLEPETRKRRRPRDDDYEDNWDRPRTKRRRRDDDDEEEPGDDRPRRKMKRRDDEQDLSADENFEEERPSRNRPRKHTSPPEDNREDALAPVALPQDRLVKCPQCQKSLKVPASAAGKKIKCPACAQIFPA